MNIKEFYEKKEGKKMIRRVVNRNFVKRGFSTFEKDITDPIIKCFDFSKNNYGKGFFLSGIFTSSVIYYINIKEPVNKYKPYDTAYFSVKQGFMLSIIWPITFPIFFTSGFLRCIESNIKIWDKEYEENELKKILDKKE